MAQGAATGSFPLFGHTPGNPQLPTLPNPGDPIEGLESLWGNGAAITARRFPTNYLETASAGPGIAKGFARTWLNQVGLQPNPLDFGNITAPKTRTTTLHNTNRFPITVTAVDLSAVSGVTLTDPGLPIQVEAFSSQVFTFEATLAGDVAFDANAIFTHTEGTIAVRMLGRRVIIFTTFPQTGISEQMSWLTDTLVSEDGTEQVMSLRTAPRSRINTKLRYSDPQERAELQNLVLGAVHLPIGTHLWHQSRELTSAALTTDLVIQVATAGMEIEALGTVGFVLNDRTSLEAEVASFDATSITLSQAIGTALPTDTSVMPIKFGFASPKTVIEDYPVTLQQFTMIFDLIDYAYIGAVDGAYFDAHPVDGLPILKDCLYVERKTRKGGINSIQSRLDSRTGQMRQSRTEPLSRPNQPILVHINSLADQEAWRKFLHFIRGSWGRFYVPTGTNDLPLSANFSLGGNTFTVASMGLESLVGNIAPRRDVRITIAGVTYDRRINSVVDNGTDETVTLSAVIPGAGTVLIDDMKVEWLTLSRLVGDTATFKHKFRGIAELRFATRGVIDGV